MTNTKNVETLDVNERIKRSEAFVNKYKMPLVIGIGALVVVIVAAILANVFYFGPRADKASTALAKGQEYFANEQFDKALNGDGATYTGFAKIADEYSGTDAANLANLYAGLCYANLGKWQDAQKYLEEYSSASDMMVSPAPTFLLQAGELLESQNNKAEALKIYQDIKKKYVNSQLVQSYEIDKYIERVSE